MIFKQPCERFDHIEAADRKPHGDNVSTFRSMSDFGAVETTPEDKRRALTYLQRQPWFSDAPDVAKMLGLDAA